MRAVILPGGGGYTPAMPLLDSARRSLVEHGYDVHAVWWDASRVRLAADEIADAWVCEQVAAVGEVDLVVGKSMGTRAATYAAERGWPAIWLTPLLTVPSCVAGIRAHPGPQLLVGGLADDLWSVDVAASLRVGGCHVVEVPDADHAMATASAVRTAEIQLEVSRAVDAFLRSLH